MKIKLTAQNLKDMYNAIDDVRDKSSSGDIHAIGDDDRDTITIEFDYGYKDKNKKEHIEVDGQDILGGHVIVYNELIVHEDISI